MGLPNGSKYWTDEAKAEWKRTHPPKKKCSCGRTVFKYGKCSRCYRGKVKEERLNGTTTTMPEV